MRTFERIMTDLSKGRAMAFGFCKLDSGMTGSLYRVFVYLDSFHASTVVELWGRLDTSPYNAPA